MWPIVTKCYLWMQKGSRNYHQECGLSFLRPKSRLRLPKSWVEGPTWAFPQPSPSSETNQTNIWDDCSYSNMSNNNFCLNSVSFLAFLCLGLPFWLPLAIVWVGLDPTCPVLIGSKKASRCLKKYSCKIFDLRYQRPAQRVRIFFKTSMLLPVEQPKTHDQVTRNSFEACICFAQKIRIAYLLLGIGINSEVVVGACFWRAGLLSPSYTFVTLVWIASQISVHLSLT